LKISKRRDGADKVGPFMAFCQELRPETEINRQGRQDVDETSN
jgi:hypothetical protein